MGTSSNIDIQVAVARRLSSRYPGSIVCVLCWLSGVVWGLGTVMHYMAADKAGFAISYGIVQCSPLIAAWVGLVAFGEMPRSKVAFFFSQIFYVVGVVSLANASIAEEDPSTE